MLATPRGRFQLVPPKRENEDSKSLESSFILSVGAGLVQRIHMDGTGLQQIVRMVRENPERILCTN